VASFLTEEISETQLSAVFVVFSATGQYLGCYSIACDIIESLRLQKTSKTTKSNREPNTTMPAKPSPEVLYLHVF